MQAYFSHSYNDIPINTYFSKLFGEERIELRADQKTDVWCMAKLERYMFEMDGFVSIIPRRVGKDDSITYSPYIGRELNLARRARVQRIVFVDDQVLDLYRNDFPDSAIPFFREELDAERSLHVEEISKFRRSLANSSNRPPRTYSKGKVTVVGGQNRLLRDGASLVATILRNHGFKPSVMPGMTMDRVFEDIDRFESIVDSELCVFILDKEPSYADLFLAMAHSHCIPSMRLQYDPDAVSCDPELSGAVRWRSAADVKSSFGSLLRNYQSVFITAIPPNLPGISGLWDPGDGPGLARHVTPDDTYVTDRVDGVERPLAGVETGRVRSDMLCRDLYDRIKKERFIYAYEPVLTQAHVQRIRGPKEIAALRKGTCIDFACLFASMLAAAHERPVVITVETSSEAHAIAGYITRDAVLISSGMGLGDLRGAINRGEIVVFETTGAVEAKGRTVGAETEAERKEGDSLLDYQTAKEAAKRLLFSNGIELKHFIDVCQARQRIN